MDSLHLNNAPLFDAISARDVSGLEKLIAEKVNVNQVSEDHSTTPLMEAVQQSWLKGIVLLIKAGAQVNTSYPFHNLSPLSIAIRLGNLEIVKLLLLCGADPNSDDIPVYYAVEEGRVDLVKTLIKAGASTDMVGSDDDETALFLAAAMGHQEVFDYLLPLTTSLQQRVWAQMRLPRGIILKQRRENTLGRDFIEAAEEGNIKVVRDAISKGVDVNAFSVEGETALHCAARRGNEAIIEILLSAGADLEIRSEAHEYTPLITAADCGRYEAVNILIKAGADINAKSSEGWTALMEAALGNHQDVVKLLISAGAEIDSKRNDGQTALMFAALNNHKEVVKILIEADANINAKDWEGWTALMKAANKSGLEPNCLETYNFLVSVGADIEAKNNKGLDAKFYQEETLINLKKLKELYPEFDEERGLDDIPF